MKTSNEYNFQLNELNHDVETTIARIVKKNNLQDVEWTHSFHTFKIIPKIGFVELQLTNGTVYNMIEVFSVQETIGLLEMIEKYLKDNE